MGSRLASLNIHARRWVSALSPSCRRFAPRATSVSAAQTRQLSLHEYQTQELFREAGISVPRGKLARSSNQAQDAAAELGSRCLLKPQILDPYGRQVGSDGVASAQILETLDEVKYSAESLFNTPGESGVPVTGAYVEEAMVAAKRWPLEIRVDRELFRLNLVLSLTTSQTSKRTAHRSYPISVLDGVDEITHDAIAIQLGIPTEQKKHLKDTVNRMYRLFIETDAVWLKTMLCQPRTGDLWCSGSRLRIDDAASKRQQKLFSQRDKEAEVPEELDAEKYSLVYVKLPGNIGTVVNGAGLAMATNDAIAYHGGSSANFLDTGGQATDETMMKAFSIVLGDKRVKVILVNIYGGIIKCDMIARSIISTAKSLGPLRIPVVIRLQGTNSEEGLHMLKEAELGMYIESDFGRAASTAVRLAMS